MIYLDFNSTAPLLPEVKRVIQEELSGEGTYNPSAIHYYGRNAKAKLEECRSDILNTLGLPENLYNIIITASGTESNNQVICSFINKVVFTPKTEHLSIISIAKENPKLVLLEVKKDGLLDLQYLYDKLTQEKRNGNLEENFLLSIMHANNETGVIQDIKNIVKIVHEFGGFVHSDIMQSIGKTKIDILDTDIDCVTLSSHKLGGMHGAAATIYKKKFPLQPLLIGGGQEFSMRAGTENLLATMAFSTALKVVDRQLNDYITCTTKLRSLLEGNIENNGGIIIGKYTTEGHLNQRITNTVDIVIPQVKSVVQLMQFDLQQIMVSNGSSCSSGKVQTSHVLKAMGYDETVASCAIRVSMGLSTTEEEIMKFVDCWLKISQR